MAFDAFLKLEGGPNVKGAAKAKGFQDQIEIYSFSWGASNPVSMESGAGMGAGKVSISSFNFMKKSDAASPLLFQACCTGDHYGTATVTLRKAGGQQVEFLSYKFSEVFVESVQWSGSSGGDDTPTESVSLAFGKVEMTYTPQDEKGGKGAAVVGGWDLHAVTKAGA
jgi:type VI secretion system secreted protein Hcp